MRDIFFKHIAQTSPAPIGLEIVKAEGIYQYDKKGKQYIDLISGFNVANIGHSNPKVIEAVKKQVDEYMHLIVYGEFIETPQTAYAKLLTEHLPSTLNCIYFTNSGAEATEGALKLAKRANSRTHIVAFNKSYHGSTQGALSVMGDEYYRNAFRPLLPGIVHVDYNSDEVFDCINETTACVILETVQAESGITVPSKTWMQQLRKKCTEQGVLLVLDEIQAGFGRTGTLWAFEQFDIVPDILLLGKALGGGMPLGAFIANKQLMQTLSFNPVLGHITTFGGHPVSCAAGKAAFEVLLAGNYINNVKKKEAFLTEQLQHPSIKKINHFGLWASLQFESMETAQNIIHKCVEHGLITDWFVFAPDRLRIAPPLIMEEDEIEKACKIILEVIKNYTRR
ncbi:aspartate aminotransferase family protein [Parafilimonas sp.]|uniref:aspartate aminotransferase family protein n=1 Tax=Parafilimonas sp. TaxID=1969739 RepID=UPI0039E6AC90